MRRIVVTLQLLVLLGLAALLAFKLLLPRTPQPATPTPPQSAVSLAQRLAAKGLTIGQPVFIRIIKDTSELELWMQGRASTWTLLHTYPICKWSGDLGPKLREGDGQAPEGFYAVTQNALNPKSAYHLSFNLGYPNAYDRAHGRTGSFLMVHGDCRSVGCYAMTDAGIEEIYGLVEAALRAGQPAVPTHIFPFRMTDKNLRRPHDVRWGSYWANLKEGWDQFEATRQPPTAYACGQTYRFGRQALTAGCTPIGGM
jgi:murein L,D-transpeptidase YafK